MEIVVYSIKNVLKFSELVRDVLVPTESTAETNSHQSLKTRGGHHNHHNNPSRAVKSSSCNASFSHHMEELESLNFTILKTIQKKYEV